MSSNNDISELYEVYSIIGDIHILEDLIAEQVNDVLEEIFANIQTLYMLHLHYVI